MPDHPKSSSPPPPPESPPPVPPPSDDGGDWTPITIEHALGTAVIESDSLVEEVSIDGMCGETLLQLLAGLEVLREQEHAGRFAIEAMDGAQSRYLAAYSLA